MTEAAAFASEIEKAGGVDSPAPAALTQTGVTVKHLKPVGKRGLLPLLVRLKCI